MPHRKKYHTENHKLFRNYQYMLKFPSNLLIKLNLQVAIFLQVVVIPSTNIIQSIRINENYSGNHKHFNVMQTNG